jgi:hypothetical protein
MDLLADKDNGPRIAVATGKRLGLDFHDKML